MKIRMKNSALFQNWSIVSIFVQIGRETRTQYGGEIEL